MIQSGKLTSNLSFYQVSASTSDSGYKENTEILLFTCKAERLRNKQNYVVDANEIFHSVELTFRMRYRSEVHDEMVVKYEDERYRVISVDKNQLANEIIIIISKINE